MLPPIGLSHNAIDRLHGLARFAPPRSTRGITAGLEHEVADATSTNAAEVIRFGRSPVGSREPLS
jgi:hypothetical protein